MMISEEGQEGYDQAEKLRIGAERQRQKSLDMNYTGNIHEDYVNEHLDYSDNEENSELEYNKYLEQAQRGLVQTKSSNATIQVHLTSLV